MRVPSSVVTEGLDGSDSSKLAVFCIERCFEETKQNAVGTLAQSGEQLAVISEIDPKNLRQGKDILAVLQGGEDRAAKQIAELDHLLARQLGQNQRPLHENGRSMDFLQFSQ